MAGTVRFQPGVNTTGGNEQTVIQRLRALARATGDNLLVTSGFRTYAQQQALQGRPGPVAAPGHSQHELGDAADVEVNGRPFWSVISAAMARRFGLATYPGGQSQDPVHVELGTASNVVGSARTGVTAGLAGINWSPCLLTWYDPALGGTNSSHGQKDPHARTASGEPYNANAFTCAAPPQYAFGTRITFKFRGKLVSCRVNDRGGAIVGHHFDLSRAAAEKIGILQAGSGIGQFAVGGTAAAAAAGVTRPGGAQPDSSQALEDAFALDYLDNPQASGPATPDVVFLGPGAPSGSRAAGGTTPVSFTSPIPGLPIGPGIHIPGIPNPLDIFKGPEKAISDATDFLKWIAWIFHPRNILRCVEFVTGLTLMGAALHVFLDANRSDPYAQRSRRRKRVRRTVVRKAVGRTPVGRAGEKLEKFMS